MALHERTHPVPVDGCFGCKVVGLSYATVPGAYRDTVSDARVDKDALAESLSDSDGNPIFSKDRVEDARSDAMKKIKEFNAVTDE